ncbi:MAG: hypothetical protein ACM3TR_04305 [Caulobacteraceae bacterium]
MANSLDAMQKSIGVLIKGVADEATTVKNTVELAGKHMSELNIRIEEVSATTEEL